MNAETSSEKTPLLPAAKPIVPIKTGLEPQNWLWLTICIFACAIRRYWLHILLSLLSCILRTSDTFCSFKFFDGLVFKTLFIVIGFVIGFRNSRANSRRGEALNKVTDVFSAAWGIIMVFPDDARAKVRQELLFVLESFAEHVFLVATPADYVLGLVGLQPRGKEAVGFRPIWEPDMATESAEEATLSPHTLILATLFKFEEKINEIDKSISGQKLMPSFSSHKSKLMSGFDGIMHLTMPSHTARYMALLDFVLLVFGIALPWGIAPLSRDAFALLRIRVHTPPLAWVIANTMLGLLVLLSLNTLAIEHENPFGGDSDDIQLPTLVNLFRSAVDGYEQRRSTYHNYCGGEKVEEHRLICGPSGVLRPCWSEASV